MKRAATILTIALCFGCNQQQDNCPPPTKTELRNQVIVDDLDWQEIASIADSAPERENSYAVGEIVVPALQATCTAFLIAPDVIMTNNHCVAKANQAQGVRLTLMKEKGVPLEKWMRFDCNEFIGTSVALDMTLLRCQGRPGETFGTVELGTDIYQGDPIYVIQQNCNYYADPYCSSWKKISRGQSLVVSNEVKHNADTLGGSSGSPLFALANHQVVALHHAGQDLNPQTGQGSANYAVAMKSILPFVKAQFPQVELGKIAPKLGDITSSPTVTPTPLPTVTPTPNPTVSLPTPSIPGGKPCVVPGS